MYKILITAGTAALLLAAVLSADAQHGRKAEPRRISFRDGKTVLRGTLSDRQEMEYVFAASKGQRITVRMSDTRLFDYRIFSAEAGLETEFDSSPELTVEMPADGAYLLFIRKKIAGRRRTARFSLRITAAGL